MSMVQGIQVLIPLVTFPYLIRVLGIEQFGLVSYALALVSFFVVFTDFGYNLTGTRDVAASRADRAALSTLFSTRWAAQGLLLLVAAAAFSALLAVSVRLQGDWLIFVLTFGLVPATILLPSWYFQGTQNFHLLATLQVASRTLYAAGIFSLVKTPGDAWLVPLLNSITALLAALTGVWYVVMKDGIRLEWPGLAAMLESLRQSAAVFASSFAVTAYNYSAVLILGTFGSDKLVGQFAVVEKILLVFRAGLSAVFSVVFPRVCQLAGAGGPASARFLRTMSRWLLPALLACGALLAYFASPILQLAAGRHDPDMVALLRWMAWIPLLIGLNMPSYQQLLAHRMQRSYTIVLVGAAAGSILLNLWLAPRHGALGTAWAVLFAEGLISLGLIFATESRHRYLAVWRRQS